MSTSGKLAEEAAYDRAPYDSHPFSRTQPSQIAAVATLFGLTPPDLQTARVLEIGGAAGGNIIPLAARYPNAQFVGIDISGRQIADGIERIEQCGLKNIELRKQSITEFDDGPFDYIIAHGVLSWVPVEVQDAMVDLLARRLAPNGLAVYSYNVLPGSYSRQPLRDVMRFRTEKIEDPAERVRAGRDIVKRIGALGTGPGYGTAFRHEAMTLPERADYYLLHEHLEGVNDAWYFRDVAARMGRAGIGYLAESDASWAVPESYWHIAAAEIRALGGSDPITLEQAIDFFLGRRFRTSIFAHAEFLAQRRFAIGDAALSRLHIDLRVPAVEIAPAPANVARLDSRRRRFVSGEQQFAVSTDLQIHTLRLLEQRRAEFGGTWFVPDLLHAVAETAPSAGEAEREFYDFIAELFTARILDIFDDAPPVAAISDRPCVFKLARVDAAHGRSETANLYHDLVVVNSAEMRRFLPLCDGTRTIAELITAVAQLINDGEIQIPASNRNAPGSTSGAGAGAGSDSDTAGNDTMQAARSWLMDALRFCVSKKLLWAADAV